MPILGEGLANGADAPFHLHRIYALAETIQAGNFYPRWIPYFHLGYGYPVFNYYAPGATHIAAWLVLANVDPVSAYNLTVALGWIIGSIGMFLLARKLFSVPVALLSSLLWVYAPSRFFEVWWQGSLAQIVSTSLIPFVFYGVLRAREDPGPGNSLCLAIPFTLIVLTHTPTSYIVAVFLLPCCLLACCRNGSVKRALRTLLFFLAGAGIAAGLSAVFLLPALTELPYVKIGNELSDTVAFLSQRFLDPSELFSFPQLVDSSDATLILPRSLGLVGALLSVVGALALIHQRRTGLALLLLAGLAFAVFLTLEQSLPVWLAIPGLRNLRFPERILRLAAMFIALLGASSVLIVPIKWRAIASCLLSILVIMQALPLTHPRDDDRHWQDISAVDEIEMEYRDHIWGTTSYNEYLPIWGKGIPFDLPPDLQGYVEDPLQIRVYAKDFTRWADRVEYRYEDRDKITIQVYGASVELRFRQFYFPGWQIWRNGESYPIEVDDEFGLLQVRLPEGEHLLELRYIGTPIQRFAALLSLLGIAACLVIWHRGRSARRRPFVPTRPLNRRQALIIICALVAFAAANKWWLQEHVFRLQSDASMPAYMRERLDVTFDESVTLLGYTLHTDTIGASSVLDLRIYWRLAAQPTSEYRPIVQLVNLGANEAWAVSQPGTFEGGAISKLAADQFLSDGHRLELFEQVPDYVGRISVQLMREDGSKRFAKLEDGSNRLLLPEIIPIHNEQTRFAGKSMQIVFGDALALHCIDTSITADRLSATLWWEVERQVAEDLHVFAHGMTHDDAVGTQSDSPPLPGYYPTSFWRQGQFLTSEVELELDDSITKVNLGLYNPETGVRLPARVAGRADDHIEVPLENSSCAS